MYLLASYGGVILGIYVKFQGDKEQPALAVVATPPRCVNVSSSPAQELLESDGFATPSEDPTALARSTWQREVHVCSLVVEHIGSFP